MVEFIRLLDGDDLIVEYNQEQCRVKSYDGKSSLIRSFPSKVGVSATARYAISPMHAHPREGHGRERASSLLSPLLSMFHMPFVSPEPGPRLLERLLRTPEDETVSLFGMDVGVDIDAKGVEIPVQSPLDKSAITVKAGAAPVMSQSELRSWLVETLGSKRGVLSAWPSVPGLSLRPSERVLALSEKAVSGHAWWWLGHLKRTGFSRRDSYVPHGGEAVSVYRMGGEPVHAFDWFPAGATYSISPGVVDRFLHYGLAMTVREFPVAGREPKHDTLVGQAALGCYLALEAATHGIGPAVLAATLVHDADDYTAVDAMRLPANAVAIPRDQVASGESKRIDGMVTVTQLHTFTLSDMLRAYTDMGPEENVKLARQEISSAIAMVVSKTEHLAQLKTIKLNMCSDNVVFCPELVETEADDWELQGFGFRSADFDSVQGKPFLSDFDPRTCKRLGQQEGYDANCAFALMTTMLLASTRAQFGDGAYNLLLTTCAPKLKAAFDKGEDCVDTFSHMLTRAFYHTRVERDAIPGTVFSEIASDFPRLLRCGVGDIGAMVASDGKPCYHSMILKMLGTRRYDPVELPSAEEAAAAGELRRRQRARLAAVVDARMRRVAVTCN